MHQGIDLHGICLFPAVDMPDWNTGTWVHNGIRRPDRGGRRPAPRALRALCQRPRHWQKTLNRVTALDDDPLSDPVDLSDIRDAAERLVSRPDANFY